MLHRTYSQIFTLMLLFIIGGCGGSGIDNTKINVLHIDGVIGKYVLFDATSIVGIEASTSLGNGLKMKKGVIQGWPQASGNYTFSHGDAIIRVQINPYYSEVMEGNNGEKIAVSWDTPNASKIVFIDARGNITNLTKHESDFQWQINADKNLENIVYINFTKDKGKDQVVYLNRVLDSMQVFDEENTMHRKPIYNSGYIYWYWDRVDKFNKRENGVSKIKLGESSVQVEVAKGVYPDVITDYSVMDNDIVAVLKKNYDKQHSDLYFYDENGNKTLYYMEDSYIQNLIYDRSVHKLFFESKKHGELWTVKSCNVGCQKIQVTTSDGSNVLLVGDSISGVNTKLYSSPMAVTEIIDILFRRYSPPLMGLSHYDNRFGILSISEGPVIRSLVNLAEHTGDPAYWHNIAGRVDVILRRTDESLLNKDFSFNSGPHWSVKVFSNGVFNPFLVHDASILDAMMLLAQKLSADSEFSSTYPGMLSQLLKLFKRNYDSHAVNLVTHNNDKFGITEEDEAYFVFHPGSTFEFDGVNLPFNMMNAYVRPLLIYAEITGDDYFRRLACSLGKVFKRHLVYREEKDDYIWPYWWGMYTKGWDGGVSMNTPVFLPSGDVDVTDVDHASLDLRAVGSLYKNQMLFSSLDVNRFSNTMVRNLADNDYRSPLLIDGRIRSANYNSLEYLWGEIIEYNSNARKVYSKNFHDLPYVQDAYTPTARFELVGLSHQLNVARNSQTNRLNTNSVCGL